MKEREIKFRGKRKDNGEWVYGALFQNKGGSLILKLRREPEFTQIGNNMYELVFDFFNVHPDTVGQYTGLKDKNGVEVYEGDLLVDEYNDEDNNIARSYLPIVWNGKSLQWCVDVSFDKDKSYLASITDYFGDNEEVYLDLIEVGGNIYDNPELLNR